MFAGVIDAALATGAAGALRSVATVYRPFSTAAGLDADRLSDERNA